MAPVGSISSTISLDKKQFQGSDDAVTGSVAITFRSSDTKINANAHTTTEQQLFGPLRLDIILQGHVKLKVLENRTSHAYILFHDVRRLFRQNTGLVNGPFKALAEQTQSFPFRIFLPQQAIPYNGARDALPPSLHTRFEAHAERQAGKHQGIIWIEYSLCVEAEMPGIDVQVVGSSDLTMIEYEQSRPPVYKQQSTREIEQRVSIQTYDLLPEHERPVGILDKTRAVLRGVPKPQFVFDTILASVPETACLGERIKFAVRIRVNDTETDSIVVPSVNMESCKVALVARTELFATNEKGVNSPKLDHFGIVATMPNAQQGLDEPFSKGNDYTKVVQTDPLPTDLPSTFRIAKVERSYRLRIEIEFSTVGQIARIRKEFALRVLPASVPRVQNMNNGTGCSAGPSRLAGSTSIRDDHEQLPAYKEATN